MKTVVITGASGNLGAAVTDVFLQKGYRVVATVFNGTMLSSLGTHPNLVVKVVDLGNATATHAFIAETVAAYQTIDAAMLLVGGFAVGDIGVTTTEDIRKQFTLNFETAYHAAQPLFTHMLGRGEGKIVFVGARPALDPAFGKDLLAYGLSKSLLFKLAEYLNETAKGTGVTATVIAPSTLDTPLNRKTMPDADPSKWVKPEAIAETLAFLVSDDAGSLRETVLKLYNNA